MYIDLHHYKREEVCICSSRLGLIKMDHRHSGNLFKSCDGPVIYGAPGTRTQTRVFLCNRPLHQVDLRVCLSIYPKDQRLYVAVDIKVKQRSLLLVWACRVVRPYMAVAGNT
jgi:hypothetical protein